MAKAKDKTTKRKRTPTAQAAAAAKTEQASRSVRGFWNAALTTSRTAAAQWPSTAKGRRRSVRDDTLALPWGVRGG